ncbi:MAG: ATP-binding protein, partial [Bacteroidota bacterium]
RASNAAFGAGIGLYIVREIVERLNGTVNLEAEEGVGTTVTLVLPNVPKSC